MAKNNKYMKYKKNKNSKFVQPTSDQIERWLRLHNIDYKSVKDQLRICNPDGDTKFSMEISKSKALVHDFRTNHKQYDGTFIRFVSKFKSISIHEAIEEVCGSSKNYVVNVDSNNEEDEELEDEIELPNGSKSIRDENDTKVRKIVMNYLVNERGLDKSVIMQSNIHYLGTSIVVPYYEYGMIVFWQLRKQLSKSFQFPPSSNKSAGDFLYGFDNVEPNTYAIVTESIFNTLSIGDDSVATGGASLKDGQIKLLKSLNLNEIILAPDNDGAGIKSLEKDFHSLKKHDWSISYCLPPYLKNSPRLQVFDEQPDWNDLKKFGINIKDYILNNKRKLDMLTIFNGVKNESFKL